MTALLCRGFPWSQSPFFSATVHLPLFWYEPLLLRFVFQTSGAGPAMDLYGRLAWCVLGGVACAALGWRCLGRLDAESTRRWELRTIVWLMVALVLAGSLQVTQLVQRHPTPLELPR